MVDDSANDATMAAVRKRFADSGLSLHDLGLKMGYAPEIARKSAWQFMRCTKDPRISMLRRFARAMRIKTTTLIRESEGKE